MTVHEIFTHILANIGMIAIALTIVMIIDTLNDKALSKQDRASEGITSIILIAFIVIIYTLEVSVFYLTL